MGSCGLSGLLRATDWVLPSHSANLLCLYIILSFHALFFFAFLWVQQWFDVEGGVEMDSFRSEELAPFVFCCDFRVIRVFIGSG